METKNENESKVVDAWRGNLTGTLFIHGTSSDFEKNDDGTTITSRSDKSLDVRVHVFDEEKINDRTTMSGCFHYVKEVRLVTRNEEKIIDVIIVDNNGHEAKFSCFTGD